MRTVSLNEAVADLSRLVDQAASGTPFVIAKDGRPLVRVLPLDAPTDVRKPRIGFLAGRIAVPDDFDSMAAGEIEDLFEGR